MTCARRLLIVTALFVFLGGCAAGAPDRSVVVWISIDGLRPDYLDRAEAPLLKQLVREGLSSQRLVPPTPSLTFPSHVTQATGVPPGAHGIPANSFYDTADDRRYNFPHEAAMLEAEPIWITAKRQGVRTLVQDWPLSHAQAGDVRTDYFHDRFDAAPSDEQRLRLLLDTWGGDAGDEPLRLLMGYVKNVDVVGHRHGPESAEVIAAVEETDALLRRFLDDALRAFRRRVRGREQFYLVLTSDHGMASAHTSVNLDKLFERPLPRGVRRITSATFAMLYLDQVPPDEREALEESLLKDLRRWDFLSAYTRESLPPEWGLAHPTRVGDIVVLLKPGHALSNRLPLPFFSAEKTGESGGVHGYAPAESPKMNGFCVIWRYPDALSRRDLGRVGAEQMHPTVARLLRVAPAEGVEATPVKLPR